LSLFGPEYAAHGTTLLRIFALGALADAVTNCYVGIRNAQRRLAEVAVLNFTIATIAVGGTAVFLRRWGIDAVGWSWATAQALGCLWVLVMALRGAIHHDDTRHDDPGRDDVDMDARVRPMSTMSAATKSA